MHVIIAPKAVLDAPRSTTFNAVVSQVNLHKHSAFLKRVGVTHHLIPFVPILLAPFLTPPPP